MKSLYSPALSALLLLMGACNLNPKPGPVPEATETPAEIPSETGIPALPETEEAIPLPVPDFFRNGRDSTDWSGTYRGTLPCSDCDGIDMSLTLFENGDFTRTQTYLGKPAEPLTDNGLGTWNEAGSVITLDNLAGGRQQYLAGEDLLFVLDRDGRPATGSDAGRYLLYKNLPDPELEDRKWILSELSGKEFPRGENVKPAFLTFHGALGQITGNNGCNLFVAAYTLRKGQALAIDAIAQTMRACPQLDLADHLGQALGTADHYTIENGMLSLRKGSGPPLARFLQAE